jgi:hypothetical protein
MLSLNALGVLLIAAFVFGFGAGYLIRELKSRQKLKRWNERHRR